jgi:hypothetical protein
MKSTHAFATELFKKKEYDFTIDLVIDGLSVTLWFELVTNNFEFNLSNKFDDDLYNYIEERDGSEITLDILVSYIEKTLAKLEHLYFYKKLGYFLSREDNMELFKHSVFQRYAKKNEDCSICYEETCTKTACNHTCCYKCMEQTTRCPICRQDFDL